MPRKQDANPRLSTNPLLNFVSPDDVDLVLAPSLQIVERPTYGWKTLYESLLHQHASGMQRVGIVPAVKTTTARYAVLQFFPYEDIRGRSPLARALLMVSALKMRHVEFAAVSNDPAKTQLAESIYDIPLYLERHASIDGETFQLWILFERAAERTATWLTLQSILVGLGLAEGARVLPYPQIRTTQHTADVIWLPIYPGNTETVQGGRLGSMRDGRTVFLDITQKPPAVLAAQPTTFDRISAKEFDRLNPILSRDAEKARVWIPKLSDQTGPSTASTLTGGLSADSEDVLDSWGRRVPRRDLSTTTDPNAAADGTSVRRAVFASVRTAIERELALLGSDRVDKDLEWIKPFLLGRAKKIPVDLLSLWREAVISVLDVNPQWVDDIIWDALNELNTADGSLVELLSRGHAVGLPEERLSILVMRWLAGRGGRFEADDETCRLAYNGTQYVVDNIPPFSTLFWRLSGSAGYPIALSRVHEVVSLEVRLLAESVLPAAPIPAVQTGSSKGGTMSAHADASVPAVIVNNFAALIEMLFDSLAGPASGHPKNLSVVRDTQGTSLEGGGKNVVDALNQLAGHKILRTIGDLESMLAEADARLNDLGITCEKVAPITGKAKAFRLTRSGSARS